MKIIVYTITDCQYSKQEKEYLTKHNLPFEEKNLETNKEYLTEMLAVSNNFAGTPVTKIEKDNGQIVVLKGFTEEEFNTNLGLGENTTPAVAPVVPPPLDDLKFEPTPAPTPVIAPVSPEPAVTTPPPVMSAPSLPPAPMASPTSASLPDPLDLSNSLPTMQPPSMPAPVMPESPVSEPAKEEPQMPSLDEIKPASSMPEPVQSPISVSTPPAAAGEGSSSAAQDEALKSILDSLKTKVDTETSPASSSPANPSQSSDSKFGSN